MLIVISALGFGTALMGKEAAMACTVAVEDAIGTHYSDQLRSLLEDASRYPDDPGLFAPRGPRSFLT